MKKFRALLIAVLCAYVFVDCASNSSQGSSHYGVIKSINPTAESSGGVNFGTLIGGVVGDLAGHKIGGGRSNAAATVASAVGGAVIGADGDNGCKSYRYRFCVRLDGSRFVTVDQFGSVADLRVGQKVQLEDGEAHSA